MMECMRCHGMMVTEILRDYAGTYSTVTAWRCPSCGDILDPVILHHRTAGPVRNQGPAEWNDEEERILA